MEDIFKYAGIVESVLYATTPFYTTMLPTKNHWFIRNGGKFNKVILTSIDIPILYLTNIERTRVWHAWRHMWE